MTLDRHRREWDELAEADAFHAVIGTPLTREEFFRTGEEEIAETLAAARRLGRPARTERALDFGCGVGRLTRALAATFDECVGVDISAGMVERARELNADRPGATFVVNDEPSLRRFDDESFDLANASIVLQHMPGAAVAEGYVRELVRVTRGDGIVVFQLPLTLPWRNRLQPRRRLYALLRTLGVGEARLYRAGLTPMRMLGLAEERVRAVVESAGGRVLATEPSDAAPPYASLVYFVAPG